MTEMITEYSAEYEAFVQAHPKGHFCQSFLWSGVKPCWKWYGILCRGGDGKITGTMAVLVRRLSGLPWSMLYAPRGPVCNYDDAETLRALFSAAGALARREHAYKFTTDPDVSAPCPALAETLTAFGAVKKPPAAGFSNIQPQYVVRLELAGKTEAELLQAMHQKTRYNIRLARRRGVEIRRCGSEALSDFQRLMEETGQRDGFGIRPQAYFEALLKSLGEHARLYMAFLEDRPIAGAIAIGYGDKVWYLYGASSNQCRSAMPNYLLQWTMIQWALERGARLYDFRGIPPEMDEGNGLWRFKRGWGGTRVEFIGEFERRISPLLCRLADTVYGIVHKE